jgi:hypothetical protein
VEFRVEPTPLSKRHSRRILAMTAVVVVTLVAVIGGITLGNTRPGVAVVSTLPPTAAAMTATATTTPLPSATAFARTGPAPRVVCHEVAGERCTAVAQAALAVSNDPALPWPSQVDVWASLLCGSDFDCPSDRMTGHQVAGSAVVTAGTVELWVNVLEPAAGTEAAALEAWVIRSGPIG